MSIRPEVMPFVMVSAGIGIAVILGSMLWGVKSGRAVLAGVALFSVFTGCFVYFFRDPSRVAPDEASLIVAGADGIIMRIKELREDKFLNTDAVRISIFLSLFDVHVNRAPISGKSRFLGYFPGKHFFTFQDKSSEYNQHNSIFITGERTCCLINQIVGPVCRRVVYWLDHDQEEDVKIGDRIGMMKFGSRLDMYFPKDDITVLAAEGEKVTAGETVIAKLRNEID